MRRCIALAAAFTILTLTLAQSAWAKKAAGCNPDAVQSGSTCIDKYEASIWEVLPANTALIKHIREGKATLADLIAGGATQLGLAAGDLAVAGCPDTGNGCVSFYAVSIPGVNALPLPYLVPGGCRGPQCR